MRPARASRVKDNALAIARIDLIDAGRPKVGQARLRPHKLRQLLKRERRDVLRLDKGGKLFGSKMLIRWHVISSKTPFNPLLQ